MWERALPQREINCLKSDKLITKATKSWKNLFARARVILLGLCCDDTKWAHLSGKICPTTVSFSYCNQLYCWLKKCGGITNYANWWKWQDFFFFVQQKQKRDDTFDGTTQSIGEFWVLSWFSDCITFLNLWWIHRFPARAFHSYFSPSVDKWFVSNSQCKQLALTWCDDTFFSLARSLSSLGSFEWNILCCSILICMRQSNFGIMWIIFVLSEKGGKVCGVTIQLALDSMLEREKIAYSQLRNLICRWRENFEWSPCWVWVRAALSYLHKNCN